ncbi:MAG: hypothetical protein Q7P63_08125 [Verrucomicrobiota bacterium JB022]|nr:hypothetical protein [Verrucomicrobiota bacterium JB022]
MQSLFSPLWSAGFWRVFLIIALFFGGSQALGQYRQSDFARDQATASATSDLVSKLPLEQTLGPLAAVAISPFFGLACLSGISLLGQQGLVPANQFLEANPVLGSPIVFFIFAGLSVLTTLPKLSKVSKPISQVADQLEVYASMISYGVILFAAEGSLEGLWAATPATPMVQAGIASLSIETILFVVAAVNLLVINTVKMFFDLLIWLCPVPTVDAIFEVASKALCGGLVAVYAFHPMTALALNLLIFLVCLVLFVWVKRRTTFYHSMLAAPPLRGIIRSLGFPHYDPDAAQLKPWQEEAGEGALVVKAFPNRKWQGIPKRGRCFLIAKPGQAEIVYPRFLRSTRRRALPEGGRRVVASLLVNSLEIAMPERRKPIKWHFSHLYDEQRPQLAALLQAPVQATDERGLNAPVCPPLPAN